MNEYQTNNKTARLPKVKFKYNRGVRKTVNKGKYNDLLSIYSSMSVLLKVFIFGVKTRKLTNATILRDAFLKKKSL